MRYKLEFASGGRLSLNKDSYEQLVEFREQNWQWFLAPDYRNERNAFEFDHYLATALREHGWTANDFGKGYAWDTSVPDKRLWKREIMALITHLKTCWS